MSEERVARRRLLLGGGVAAAAVAGAVAPGMAGADPVIPLYFPAGPARLYDSRVSDGPLLRNQTISFPGSLDAGILAFGINVTITSTKGANGYLSFFPSDEPWPGTSSINWFAPGQTVANYVMPVGSISDGGFSVRCGGAPGASTDFILDLVSMQAFVDIGASLSSMRQQSAAVQPLQRL